MIKKILLLAVMLLPAIPGHLQTISQWRGPERNGVYDEPGLLKSWPPGGPAMIWKTEIIGNGYGHR